MLPSTLSYSIKLKGKIQLGDEMAALFKELSDSIMGQVGQLNSKGLHDYKISKGIRHKEESDEDSGLPQPKDFPFGDIPLLEDKPESQKFEDLADMPLLDEIVKNKANNAHVYGKHKKPAKVDAFNNIQV